MARLTRTQKYAELRERMAHDVESGFSTPDLGKYEEKLTALDDLFKIANSISAGNKEEDINLDALGLLGDIKLNTEAKKVVEEVKPVVETVIEETVQNISQEKNEKVLSIEEMVENMVSQVEKEIRKVAPVEVKPTTSVNVDNLKEVLPTAVEEKVNEVEAAINELFKENKEELDEVVKVEEENIEETTTVEETVIEDVVNVPSLDSVEVLVDNAPKAEPVVEIKEEVKEAETVKEEVVVKEKEEQEVVINVPNYANDFEGISDRSATMISLMDPSMTPEPIKEEEIIEESIVEEEVQPVEETLEIESEDLKNIDEFGVDELPEITNNLDDLNLDLVIDETEEIKIDNSFIDDALKEVKEYNLEKGNQTIDEIPSTIIDEVRHSEVEVPVEEDEEDVDLDVSNTISLELNKVLSSMESITAEIDVEEVEEAKEEVNEVEEVEETRVVDIAELEEPEEPEVEEHQAIAQTLEDDGVAIKSLDETLKLKAAQVVTNVLEDTVPFDISGEEEYEDDDVPSKTLNIILGVLIAVLVLVLCVIIYYILVARGILG